MKSLGVLAERGVTIAKEWLDGTVGPSGTGKYDRQKSLRNKIYSHNTSKAHAKSCEILDLMKKRKLEETNSKQLNEHQITTQKIFRVAYHQAKTMSSFKGFEDEILLQKENMVLMLAFYCIQGLHVQISLIFWLMKCVRGSFTISKKSVQN